MIAKNKEVSTKQFLAKIYFWEMIIKVLIHILNARARHKEILHIILYVSRDMRFPTMWYVRPARDQTSLHIHAF